jgi:hypothetical protein
MTGWNPNFSCAQGLEWGPERQAERSVTGRGPSGYAWSLSSSAREDATFLWTFSQGKVDTALDLIDIYDVSDLRTVPEVENISEPGVATITANAPPSGQRYTGAYWDTSGTTPQMVDFRSTNLPTGISNMADVLGSFGNLTPALYESQAPGKLVRDTFVSLGPQGAVNVPHREFLGFVPMGQDQLTAGGWNNKQTAYPFRVTGLNTGFTAGTDRVLGLSTSVLAQKIVRGDLLSEFGDWPVWLNAFLIPATSWVGSGRAWLWGPRIEVSLSPEQYGQTWAINPFTSKEWTPAELASFGSTAAGSARIGWRITTSLVGGNRRRIIGDNPFGGDRVYGAMESIAGAIFAADFRTVAVEDTRVAFAYRTANRRQKTGWNKWAIEAIGGGTWAKQAGAEYLFHQVVDETAFGGGPVARGLNIRVLGTTKGGGRIPLRERIPQFVGTVPVSAGEIRPWAPAAVLEVTP